MSGAYRALGLALGQPPIALAETLELAKEAEEAGFGMLGVGDLLADSFTLVGALAARTERAELFTCVAGWTRTPVSTALSSTTATELSGGRFRLGLGAMPQAWSEEWHGVDYAQPVERMREFVGAVRAALGSSFDSPTSFAGERYSFRNYVRFSPEPADPVPIYLGATRPAMTKLAGELADGVLANAVHSVAWLRDVQVPALEAGLAAAGRPRGDVDVSVLVICAIDEDVKRARQLARQAISVYFVAPYFGDLLRHHGLTREFEDGARAASVGDQEAATAAVSDELVELMAVCGSAAEVRGKLARYEGLADWLMLSPPIGGSSAVVREQTERIIATLGPAAG
ncbi:MAG: LLM class flavin-dependent oxidoreductase, partial [Gaiellaceae bacterium]